MKSLQKIVLIGALFAASLIGGCKDSKNEQMRAVEESAREQRLFELKIGIVPKDNPTLRELILKNAYKIEDYGDPYSGACGKKVTYGDGFTGEWNVAYFPEN